MAEDLLMLMRLIKESMGGSVKFVNFLSLLIVICSSSVGRSQSNNEIQRSLINFHSNPSKAMDQVAPEVIAGKLKSRGSINYIDVSAMRAERNSLRQQIMAKSPQQMVALSKMGDNDQATNLVENKTVDSQIDDLDRQGLIYASLTELPWTDSYWPIYKGLLGHRYADPGFPDSKIWQENYNYILSNPASSVVAVGNQSEINNLSPSEKYDFLVGDQSMTMTNYSWKQGQNYLNRVGFVETWMGICHGWAGAAHMLQPVINAPVTLQAANGMPITFYQSDVKALQSLLWANSSPPTRFSGTACKTLKPERDPYGRVLDPGCLDNNPATFFLTLTNQLGIHKRSFIMDATYDAEVWNHPITSYKMTYFNPQSLHPAGRLNQAVIPIEQFTIDKFRSYRSSEAKYVVGIVTDVTFIIEVNPSHGISNKPPTKTLRFMYDLELSANKNVIGGEWYMNSHPDFMWTYEIGGQAMARGESAIHSEEWNVSGPIPTSWRPLAQQASAAGSPMYSVIKRIIEAAPHSTPGEVPYEPTNPPTEGTPTNP